MAITQRTVGPVSVVYLRGRFYGSDESDELERIVMGIVNPGHARLVINLKDCERLVSREANILGVAKQTCDANSGQIKLCCLNKAVTDMLTVAGLLLKRGLEYYNTEEEALASFARTPTKQ